MSWPRLFLCLCLYMGLAVALQWADGAFERPWTTEPDEASHFLNGLMARDYFVSGMGEHPLRYAERYYAHYPRIALGHYPPLFAAFAGAWFLAAPVSYASALVLLALLASGIATTITWVCAHRLPFPLAFGSGVAWLLLPVVRRDTETFMAEMLLTLMTVFAVIAFSRRSLQFGFWSGLAVLTKGSALALALLPPGAILLSRRWETLRERWLWLSAAMVVAMAGPWYALAPDALHQKVRVYGGYAPRPWQRLLTLPEWFWWSMGPVVCALAIFGLVAFWRRFREDALWLAFAAMIPASLLPRIGVAVWETRHLVMMMPEIVCFAALGFHELAQRAPVGRARRGAVLGMAVAVAVSLTILQPPRKTLSVAVEIARAIPAGRTVLVSGTTPFEGAVISELAIRDTRRPGRVVLRGSKSLASWNPRSQSFEPLFNGAAEAGEILRKLGVEAVAVDVRSVDLHNRQLDEYLRGMAREWRPAGIFGGRTALYLRIR